ncbi:MAG: cation diffusion facilitator family transporter [Salinigranum sp.]
MALGINTAFFGVEIVGALMSNSLTLFADAVHMLTDSGSLGLALFAAWIATRPADSRRTYGYHRAEVLGALANGVFLLAVVVYVLYDAYRRFVNPVPVDQNLVIVVGVVGLFANLAAAWVLSGHRASLNVEGAFLHLLADAAGSVAAIALGLALTFTDFYVLDPIFAVLIAGLVLYSAKDLLADSLNILLQGSPRDVDVDRVSTALCDIDGVESVHDVHVWSLDSSRSALSAHVVVGDDVDSDGVLVAARGMLGDVFDIDHATVQVEYGDRVECESFDCYPADGRGA